MCVIYNKNRPGSEQRAQKRVPHRGPACTHTPEVSWELTVTTITTISPYLAPIIHQTLEPIFSESICANLGLCYIISHYAVPRERKMPVFLKDGPLVEQFSNFLAPGPRLYILTIIENPKTCLCGLLLLVFTTMEIKTAS